MARIADSGEPLICLGGDHAITHPILRAVRPHHPKLTILHIDAHADIYHAYQGNPRSHASPFARIMEERLADRLVQVGVRAMTRHQREQADRFGVEVIDMRAWVRGGREWAQKHADAGDQWMKRVMDSYYGFLDRWDEFHISYTNQRRR